MRLASLLCALTLAVSACQAERNDPRDEDPDTDSDTERDTDPDTEDLTPAEACAAALSADPVTVDEKQLAALAFDGRGLWYAWGHNEPRQLVGTLHRMDCRGQTLMSAIPLQPEGNINAVNDLVIDDGVVAVSWLTRPEPEWPLAMRYAFYDAETGAELGAGSVEFPDANQVYGSQILATDAGWFMAVTAEDEAEALTLHVLSFGPDHAPEIVPGGSYPRQGWLNRPGQLTWDGEALHLLFSEDRDDDWVAEVYYAKVGDEPVQVGSLDTFGKAGLFQGSDGTLYAHYGVGQLLVQPLGGTSTLLLPSNMEQVEVVPVGDTLVLSNNNDWDGGTFCMLAELTADPDSPAIGNLLDTRPGCPTRLGALGDAHVVYAADVDNGWGYEIRAVGLDELRTEEGR